MEILELKCTNTKVKNKLDEIPDMKWQKDSASLKIYQ